MRVRVRAGDGGDAREGLCRCGWVVSKLGNAYNRIERAEQEEGVPVGTEGTDESCCGTAAAPESARARERTTILVLTNMVPVVSVWRKCSEGGWKKERKGSSSGVEGRKDAQSYSSGACYMY